MQKRFRTFAAAKYLSWMAAALSVAGCSSKISYPNSPLLFHIDRENSGNSYYYAVRLNSAGDKNNQLYIGILNGHEFANKNSGAPVALTFPSSKDLADFRQTIDGEKTIDPVIALFRNIKGVSPEGPKCSSYNTTYTSSLRLNSWPNVSIGQDLVKPIPISEAFDFVVKLSSQFTEEDGKAGEYIKYMALLGCNGFVIQKFDAKFFDEVPSSKRAVNSSTTFPAPN